MRAQARTYTLAGDLVPDAYDAAATQIDQGKLATLAAMAQGGMAQVQAYQAAQQQIAAQQQAAVQGALGHAAANNAPDWLQANISATVNAPYQRYAASSASQMAQAQATNAAAQAANSAYFDQARAAIPALRTYSQGQAASSALDNRLKELTIREKEERLNGGGGSLLGALNKEYGGVSGGNRALLTSAKNYVTEHGGNWGHAGTSALLAQFDREAGLPEGYTRALLKPAKGQPNAKPTQRQQQSRTLTAVEKRHGADSATARAIKGITSRASSLAKALAMLDVAYDDDMDEIKTPNGARLNKTRLATYLRSYYA